MILIIDLCKNELHHYEFVKPIIDIVDAAGMTYMVRKLKDIKDKDTVSSSKIIICGTSLRDHDYLKNDVSWIKGYNKPILGICAGMQLICLSFGCKMVEGLEIGLIDVDFKKEFLGMKGKNQAYALHNNAIIDNAYLRNNFLVCGSSLYVQAIKHKSKPIFATLFHPEARSKAIIENFLYL